MMNFDRFKIRVVATTVGLCGLALTLSPAASANSMYTGGGYACLQSAAGEVSGVPAGAAPVCAAAAPVADMAGVPMALPGPLPAGPAVPVVPALPMAPALPLPIAPVVPAAGAPLAAAPAPVGAPIVDMLGQGKEHPVTTVPDGAPKQGQPIAPGPTLNSAS
jgi:hypothetical protein